MLGFHLRILKTCDGVRHHQAGYRLVSGLFLCCPELDSYGCRPDASGDGSLPLELPPA